MAENSHSSTSTATNEQISGDEDIEEVLQTSTPNRRRNPSSVTSGSGDFHDDEAIESSSHNDSESSSRPNTPKPRGPQKRSPIWKYFRLEGSVKDIKSFCLVKIKDKDNEEKDCSFVGNGRNTTNSRLHQKHHHPEEMKKLKEYDTAAAAENKSKERPGAGSGVSRSSGGIVDFFNKPSNPLKPRVRNPYPPKSSAYKSFKEDLTRLAGCTSFPLSMVESSYFHALLFNANSRLADSLPSRNTLKK
jgi:hypothetical protein